MGLVLVTAMSASLAWQSADWLRLLRSPAAASDNTSNEAAVAVHSLEIGHLFGTHNATSDGPAPSTNLRLTLLGSFVHADPARSTAIIRSEGSTAQRYSIDSEISSGVRLHSSQRTALNCCAMAAVRASVFRSIARPPATCKAIPRKSWLTPLSSSARWSPMT